MREPLGRRFGNILLKIVAFGVTVKFARIAGERFDIWGFLVPNTHVVRAAAACAVILCVEHFAFVGKHLEAGLVHSLFNGILYRSTALVHLTAHVRK